MDLIFILNLTCRRVTLRAVRCPRLSPLEALFRYIAIWRPTRCCHRLPEDSDPATEWWSEDGDSLAGFMGQQGQFVPARLWRQQFGDEEISFPRMLPVSTATWRFRPT